MAPPSTHARPQFSAGRWQRYAKTSTPGTSPPRKPRFRATVSSWILLVDCVAVLKATTSYRSASTESHPTVTSMPDDLLALSARLIDEGDDGTPPNRVT